jgi:hypothetical protein
MSLLAAGLVLFALGFPLVSALQLWRNRNRLNDAEVVLVYGFLYEEYEDQYYAWETVIMLRKAALLACAVFLRPFGAAVQLLSPNIILAACIFVQVSNRCPRCSHTGPEFQCSVPKSWAMHFCGVGQQQLASLHTSCFLAGSLLRILRNGQCVMRLAWCFRTVQRVANPATCAPLLFVLSRERDCTNLCGARQGAYTVSLNSRIC